MSKRKELKARALFILNQLYALEQDLLSLSLPDESLRFASIASSAMNGCLHNLNDRRK